MDRISDANGIIWLFLGIMLYCLLTVIFTFGVWANSEKISRFFYPAGVIATIIILFCDMEIAFFSAAYEPALIHFLLYVQTATFCGQQGRISRTVRAILNGQPGISAGQRVLRPTDQY